MSRKSGIDPEVMQADRYLEQSLAAQALYPQLLMESDTMGVVVGVHRVVRATGIEGADNALDELIANGYVVPIDIETGTVHVIRHYFINNNYEKRLTDFSKFKGRLPEYIETPVRGGQLYGIPYKSATSRLQVAEERIGKDGIGKDGIGKDGIGGERIGGERNRRGEPTPPAQSSKAIECPCCHGEAFLSDETKNGFTQFECFDCHNVAWIDTDTGTVVDNPYNNRDRSVDRR